MDLNGMVKLQNMFIVSVIKIIGNLILKVNLGNYFKKGKEYIKGILEYEGEYYKDKKWNGKGYDVNGIYNI